MSDQELPNEGTENLAENAENSPNPEVPEPAPETVESTKEIPKANNKKLIILVGAVVILMTVVIGVMSMCSKEEPEPTVDELRIQHLEYISKFLESYKTKNGGYPQPTMREETKEGIIHVWGYEKDVPALASCEMFTLDGDMTEEGSIEDYIEPELSHCGGNIYDLNGNLIGWKGTLTLESGLNNIDVANLGDGRILSPISETNSRFPTDPAFEPYTKLKSAGFGEYIYAVRIPENKANDKGGYEYQIAASIPDTDTGKLKTYIRGNYYVKTDERDIMPASLIGSGILFDKNNLQIEGQESAIQVLMDEQKEGLPHPSLGDGEEVLKILNIKQRAQSLMRAIENREDVVSAFTSSASADAFVNSLSLSSEEIEKFISSLPSVGSEQYDVDSLNQEILDIADSLSVASETFVSDKAGEVQAALELEVNSSDVSESILRRVLNDSESIEDAVLFARDEVIKYLDGEGIEDQSRSRAGRKIEDALELVPNVNSLFNAQKLETPYVFLLEDDEGNIKGLAKKEGSLLPEAKTETIVTLNKIASDLVVHVSELEVLLSQIIDELKNTSSPLEDIDESLKRLSRALASENERIGVMFDNIASENEVQSLLSVFNDKKKLDGNSIAISYAGSRCGLFGNFSPLNFSASIFNSLSAMQSPGIPFEENYTGIPYPLP
jgi:hypothetical protein